MFQVYLRVTLKTHYTAYADDVTAMTKVSIVPIPTALVIRNWDTVWNMIGSIKSEIQNDLKTAETAPRDRSYYISFDL